MIIDLAGYAGPDEISCDICIAGAGAAGLTIAAEFLGRSEKVVVLEGGGMDYSDESQDSYRGEIVGRDYFDLDVARLRYFGGTTNHWAGWTRPLEGYDFEPRPWVPHGSWPIRKEDLDAYLHRALAVLDMGHTTFRVEDVTSGLRLIDLDRKTFAHKPWVIAIPVPRLGEKYRARLERAENVHVFVNASLNDIALADNRRETDAFYAVGLGGRRIAARARWYVLALGGLENPRLLLNTDRQMPNGIGNAHGLVGRFFMEHPEPICGQLMLRDATQFASTYGSYVEPGGNDRVRMGIGLSDGAREGEHLLNAALHLDAVTTRLTFEGYNALRHLVFDMQKGRLDDLGEHVWAIMTDLDGVVAGAYRKAVVGDSIDHFDVVAVAEQQPNPDSRVLLVRDTDGFGLRRIALDWRLTALDKNTVRTTVRKFGREVGRLGIGRLRMEPWLADGGDDWPSDLRGGYHHMGTTRMADDPKQGVVDRHCRTHDLANLYVAGSSVFPTGGFANPTLTIIQLALRLSDRLKSLA